MGHSRSSYAEFTTGNFLITTPDFASMYIYREKFLTLRGIALNIFRD